MLFSISPNANVILEAFIDSSHPDLNFRLSNNRLKPALVEILSSRRSELLISQPPIMMALVDNKADEELLEGEQDNASSNSSTADKAEDNPLLLFPEHSIIKRRHTKLLMQVAKLIYKGESDIIIAEQIPFLQKELEAINQINARYLNSLPEDTTNDVISAAATRMEAIEERSSAAVEAVTNYLNQLKPQRKKKIPGQASKSWNVSGNTLEQGNRRTKSEREQQDIQRSIDHKNHRMEILSGAPKNPLTSTPRSSAHHSPNINQSTVSPLGQAEAANQPPTMAHSSSLVQIPFSRWAKISITPFDGDSRHWPPFAHAIHATVEETNMPDSYKLMSLRDSLTDDIRKRMAHIFTGRNSYTQAWSELQ
ncbi:Uncharacterized protein APZ42_003377 [Daphnia magna]|uniref:Uncharacterized protein n=1 Tax=Daphnia magna TaxID=35525 RepID=A0A164HKL0_9CRUS|nr:Uncharacterized protein APZ42_003377 [Daphnia magna]